jgi:nitroreductase
MSCRKKTQTSSRSWPRPDRCVGLKPDPVPAPLTRKILEAGVSAPSGGNMQRWRFLVIRDPKVKQTVGAYYKRAWDEVVAPRYRGGEPAPGTSRERFLRMLDSAQYLADHIHEAPVWIVPCMGGGTPTRTSGSSIYPAVQNMLLAARALGLGATLTTLYLNFEKEVEAALGLPADVHSYAYCRSDTRWDVSGRYAACLSPMSSMKIAGIGLTAIKARHREVGCGAPDAGDPGSTRRS